MEVTVIRLDHLKCRTTYVKILKQWLEALSLHARLISKGNLHVLVVQGDTKHVDQLLIQYTTQPIDTNA